MKGVLVRGLALRGSRSAARSKAYLAGRERDLSEAARLQRGAVDELSRAFLVRFASVSAPIPGLVYDKYTREHQKYTHQLLNLVLK